MLFICAMIVLKLRFAVRVWYWRVIDRNKFANCIALLYKSYINTYKLKAIHIHVIKELNV